MRVVTLLNQKGGVGKTSTCFHLAGTIAGSKGRKVLLIDNDPQASLTQGFFGPVRTSAMDARETIHAVYKGDCDAGDVIRRTDFADIDIVPGRPAASRFNAADPESEPVERRMAIAELLGQVDGMYKLVLIDCPPNLQLCSWASLAASSDFIIPTQAEDFGAQGIGPVLAFAELVRRRDNPDLELLGLLMTMFNRRQSLAKLYDTTIRKAYDDDVFIASMPRAVSFPEAVNARRPVQYYRPKSKTAAKARLAMELIAVELESRLGRGRTPAWLKTPRPAAAEA